MHATGSRGLVQPLRRFLAGFFNLSPWLRMSDVSQRAQYLRQRRRVFPVFLLILGLLIASNVYMVWHERQQLIEQSLRAQQSLVNAMADRLLATLQKASMLAVLLADDLVDHPERVKQPEYRARLAKLAGENPDIEMIALVQPDGTPAVSSLPTQRHRLNFSDRDYFRHHQANPGDELLIGTPLVNRASHKRFIPISRRITDRQGRFAGVVLIALDSEALVAEFRALHLGPRSFIAINHLDGHILSRHPPDPEVMGRSLRGTPQYEEHFVTEPAGSFTSVSPIDGLERRYVFKRLNDYPLMMVTGVSDDDLMDAWMSGARVKAGYLIALSALLALVALYLYRQLGRLQDAESESQSALARTQTYQAALDDFVIAVLLDADGVVLEVNERFCSMSGFSRDELVGRRLPPLDGRVDDPEFKNTLLSTMQAGSVWRGVRLARSKRGNKYWLNSCLLPLPPVQGMPRRFLLVQVDITNLKDAEERMAGANEALNEALALTNAVFDSAFYAIIASDATGRIVMFNESAERLLGYKADEVRGKLSPLIFHDPDEVAAVLHTTLPSTLLAGITYADLIPLLQADPRREWTYRSRNGSSMPVQLHVSPLRRRDGTVSGHVTIVTELSQQKQLDRLKSDFVSVVSHELRTPLTSIKGAIAIVNESMTGTATPQQLKLMGVAADSCDRLVRLVSDILDLDKLSRGQMPLHRTVQSLQALVEEAIQSNEPYAIANKSSYRLIGLPEPVYVDVDTDRMLQVLTNLLSNSAKFSAPGSEVRIRLAVSENDVIIAVEDDGIGIPAEFHPFVFERFTQSDAVGTRRKGGSGLGLSIAKSFVDAHGGTLTFESKEALGTTFYVRLPRAGVAKPSMG